MSIVVKAGLAAALALAPVLSMAAYAASEPVTGSEPDRALLVAVQSGQRETGAVATQAAPGASFLARSVAQIAPPSTGARAAIDTDPMKVALAGKPRSTPVFGNLRGNAGLLLWNFCVMVRAQQDRQAFELVNVGITSVKLSEDIARVSAVPLPGAVWLFVMAVLGLAGTRVTGLKTGKNVARTTDAAAPRLPHRGPAFA